MNSCHAHLIAASPFHDLFEHGMAPIKTPLPAVGDCLGDGVQTVYFLDPKELTAAQIDAVAQRVAEVFNADAAEVREELIENGLPIRAAQTTGVSFPSRLIL